MPAPIIGVTTSEEISAKGVERAFLNASYIRAIERAGGVPLLLAPQHSPAALARLSEVMDGVLLTGGGDIDPARWGEAPHAKADRVSAERDTLELEHVTRRALDTGTPLLAICRGLQVLNVALNGTLHQHVPDVFGQTIAHTQSGARSDASHEVTIEPGTLLADLSRAEHLSVNSFHHQAIKDLGDGLKPVAWSEDKVIEAVELPGARGFVLAVQWHPEELVEDDPASLRLFQALVDAARQRRR
ncbi:MAG: gamma-glutamyl-gamma-aminobutyrate hydrolase family protein [Candidatus Rokubacteria bacterium]|nr:gamma-glutamyl-gamma-aminobutyrate hydrolase family protein [Candidatus Rokubacteria bacterium]